MTRSFQQIRSMALTLAPIGLFAICAFGVLLFDRPVARAADSITSTASVIATPRFTTTPITSTVRATNTLTGTLATSTRAPTARFSPTPTPTLTATATTATTAISRAATLTITATPSATTAITRTATPTITLTPTATTTLTLGTIFGRLSLQGNRIAGDILLIATRDQITIATATITGTRSATITPPPFAVRDVFTTTMSASASSFTFALPPGVYTITARKPGFLPISRAAVQIASAKSIALPEIALIGGDVNGDGEINARDVALIGANFAKQKDFDVNADINGDGVVNVLDLVIVTQNLGKKGTVQW